MSRHLFIVPMNEIALNEYFSWFKLQGARRPPTMPEHAVLVCTMLPNDKGEEEAVLVSGVGLFPTKGLYLLVEGFATNPAVPLKIRHAAAVFSLRAVRVYAACVGKLPIVITNKLGIYRLAKAQGWIPHAQAAVLEVDPMHRVVTLPDGRYKSKGVAAPKRRAKKRRPS